jgi:uroporphyrinogen decarboxylase
MKLRYDADTPGRLGEQLDSLCGPPEQRTAPVTVYVSGPFWQMREWCGFEGLCTMMLDEPDLVAEMAAFWCEFVAALLERLCRRVVPDALMISEDMAYKAKAMISPAMTRRFCQPSWIRWTEVVAAAGCPLVDMDSDGFIGELIPLWIESGINVCNPMEVAAGNDINDFRRHFGRTIAYRCGVDKRAIAAGGKTIRAELTRLEPVIRDGGFIPGCDHGVPADVSWPNYLDYARRLAELTGWL